MKYTIRMGKTYTVRVSEVSREPIILTLKQARQKSPPYAAALASTTRKGISLSLNHERRIKMTRYQKRFRNEPLPKTLPDPKETALKIRKKLESISRDNIALKRAYEYIKKITEE